MKLDAWKVLLVAVWLAVLAAPFGVFGSLPTQILLVTGAVLAISHIAEYLIFHRRIRALPESALTQFLMTFVFGLFYWSAAGRKTPADT